jgi:hypothetical protein
MGLTGSADLPLHGGRVPAWLAGRMVRLGRVIAEAVVHHYGRDALLARLAHPFWFQSFGAVMGMDWHSSGVTTSVMGALKRGLAPVEAELGLRVCGGRGRHSRKTPDELVACAERLGLDGDALARSSRLVAKVDSAAVQDGFQLYLHCFVLADDGAWVVIQQGMRPEHREARRYHWQSLELEDYFDDPHAAIEGPSQGAIRNLADARAKASRDMQLALLHRGPDVVVDVLPHLRMPAHHEVRAKDVNLPRLRATLAAAAERAPRDFADLLLIPGVGARTVESLALVAELVHGAPSRFSDPARFSYAHGGKNGHPFPVPIDVYDHTLRVMRDTVDRAKLGNDDRLAAMQRLDREAHRLEAVTERRPSWHELVARETRRSPGFGGRSVLGAATGSPEAAARRPGRGAPVAAASRQLSLFSRE